MSSQVLINLPAHVQAFRESTESELRSIADMELRAYRLRLLCEAKRVRQEMQRRSANRVELNDIAWHANIPSRPSITKTDKQQERADKQRAVVMNALNTLSASMQSGKLSMEDAMNLVKKASK